MFKNLKEILPDGKVKRQKKDKRDLPKARGNGKGVRIFIWTMIIVVGCSGVFAYSKAIKADKVTQKTQTAIEKLENKKVTQTTSAYDNHTLLMYSEAFLQAYINIPLSNEQRQVRTDNLTNYYAEGITQDDVSGFVGYRTLKDKTYFSTEKTEAGVIVKYKVTYTNVNTVEKQRTKPQKYKEAGKDKVRQVVEKYNEEVKHDVTALVNIPIVAEKEKFAVSENIYFSAIPTLNAEGVPAILNNLEESPETSASTKEDVESYLMDFFQKYAAAPLTDLGYMMAEPEGLQGIKVFDSIPYLKVYTGNKKEVIAKVKVIFKDKETELLQTELFTLDLEKKDGNYFVKALKHTLGGNE
ncbi:conjugal transfer protein [Listeria booriae]|uniref:conjugal transfer protein n=1 Tax=Listeria booriae TaxID=1552123 RepID=UPI0016246B0D|nr:conjugal transfer protein [Listeria booriae]MBC1284868.1 conjugal transfer protein [Listeria booriae]